MDWDHRRSSVPRSCATVAIDLDGFSKHERAFSHNMPVATVVVSVKKD